MRRPNRKGNIITVYAIQRDIHRSETTEGFWNSVDAVLAPCWVTASVEFMERAGYPPISPGISHEDQEPIIRNREVVDRAQPTLRFHRREFDYHPLAVGKRRQTGNQSNSPDQVVRRLRRLTEGRFDGR